MSESEKTHWMDRLPEKVPVGPVLGVALFAVFAVFVIASPVIGILSGGQLAPVLGWIALVPMWLLGFGALYRIGRYVVNRRGVRTARRNHG